MTTFTPALDLGIVQPAPSRSRWGSTAVDRRRLLLGSANLSIAGLVGNHEMAIVADGAVAEVAAGRIEHLFSRLPVWP
jgi:hypothetical protein